MFRDQAAALLFVSILHQCRNELGFALLSYVVMPGHVHLVIVPTAPGGLAQTMQLLKGRFARMYNQLAGRSGTLWQPRYYEEAVRSEIDLMRRIRYIEDNPVNQHLAAAASEYPYSSAHPDAATDLDAYLNGRFPAGPG